MLQSMESVHYMFTTCVILHNMIIKADGRDKLWESNVQWDGSDCHHDINDEEWSFAKENREILHFRAINKLTDYARVGRRFVVDRSKNIDDEWEDGFFKLRRMLVNHYAYLRKYFPEKIEWLN